MKQTIADLICDLNNTRQRTLELLSGLDAEQLLGPKLSTVNPLIWEVGHAAYFYEFWILRHHDHPDKQASFLKNADELYDSITIAHNDSWDLPLLTLEETKRYMQQVHDAVIHRLQNNIVTDEDVYLTRYAVFHEDMHTEAYTYSRRTLKYPAPTLSDVVLEDENYDVGGLDGDVTIEGREFLLGANKNSGFCFDNEKWQHTITIKTFSIARAATSYQQYADFVEDNGYIDKEYWSEEGWTWLQSNKIRQPNGWKKNEKGNWLIQYFDRWEPLRPHAAVIHINWFEANAWCKWAQRRLPSEAEWELAASGSPDMSKEKTNYPWSNQIRGNKFRDNQIMSNELISEKYANMNSRAMRTIDVGALPESDSAFGCRQMLGNVWEWTADTFNPYPGFTPDMYEDYSQPLFGITKVLRGGAWTTRSRMIRNTWRTYYGAERNDVFAGFRTCAL